MTTATHNLILTPEELDVALYVLKCNKAGGGNGMIPAKIKRVEVPFEEHILELFKDAWTFREVPRELG